MHVAGKIIGSIVALALGALFIFGIAFAFALGHAVQIGLQLGFAAAALGTVAAIWMNRERLAVALTGVAFLVFVVCIFLIK